MHWILVNSTKFSYWSMSNPCSRMLKKSRWLAPQLGFEFTTHTCGMEAQIENLFFKGPLAELMRTDRLTVGLTKNIGDQKLWGWNGVKVGPNWGLYGPLWGAIWSNEVSMTYNELFVIGFRFCLAYLTPKPPFYRSWFL